MPKKSMRRCQQMLAASAPIKGNRALLASVPSVSRTGRGKKGIEIQPKRRQSTQHHSREMDGQTKCPHHSLTHLNDPKTSTWRSISIGDPRKLLAKFLLVRVVLGIAAHLLPQLFRLLISLPEQVSIHVVPLWQFSVGRVERRPCGDSTEPVPARNETWTGSRHRLPSWSRRSV